MQLWDVIVVGAGPAGCAAAYDLAAGGRSVLLLDRVAFPRAKACAGGLTAKAVQALRYSIAPVVRRTIDEIVLEPPAPSLPATSSQPGRNGTLRVGRGRPVCVMTVRAELDAWCLEQTRARGAVFRRVGPLLALREEGERVLLHCDGEPEPFAARFLVGADGVHSRIRALAFGESAHWFRKGFALEANVPYSVTGREFPLVFDFSPVRGGYGWLFPRDTHVNVGLYVADGQGGSPGQNGSAEKPPIHRAGLTQYIAERCGTREHERAVGQFLGLGAAGYAPGQSRVLLAGDAAGFVDPLTGEGIYGAIMSGQAAAKAILRSLSGGGAIAYQALLARLRADLAVAEHAARKFYAEPERGFRLMRLKPVRRAVLHAYSEGTSLALLARGISVVRGALRYS